MLCSWSNFSENSDRWIGAYNEIVFDAKFRLALLTVPFRHWQVRVERVQTMVGMWSPSTLRGTGDRLSRIKKDKKDYGTSLRPVCKPQTDHNRQCYSALALVPTDRWILHHNLISFSGTLLTSKKTCSARSVADFSEIRKMKKKARRGRTRAARFSRFSGFSRKVGVYPPVRENAEKWPKNAFFGRKSAKKWPFLAFSGKKFFEIAKFWQA